MGKQKALHFIQVSVLLVIGLVAQAAAQLAPIPQARERIVTVAGKQKKVTSKLTKMKKVLVPEFFFNYNHTEGRPEVDRLFNIIAERDSLEFTYISEAAKFDPATFSQYAVIVANNITDLGKNSLGSAKQTAIQSYIEAGGGFMMIHGSGDTKDATWTWYKEKLHPAIYSGEAVIGQTARIYQPASNSNLGTALGPNATPHPIMEGIPHDTTMAEEYHNFQNLITEVVPTADVLFLVDQSTYSCGGCTPSPNHPLAWTFKISKGTVVFCGIGHSRLATTSWGKPNPTDIRGPYWQRFLQQSIYWAAGYDTSEVVSLRSKPEDYQFYARDMAFHDKDLGVVFTENGPNSAWLLDMRGKVLRRESSSQPQEFVFDKGRMQRGFYVLRASTSRGTHSKRYFIDG